MGAGRPFRVRVVSPLEATEADLARRQRRYGAHAGPGTRLPLFMPGLVALRVMEHLWTEGLWPR